MFKKINEIKKSRSKKEDNRKATIKVYKRPIFLIAGLIALIAVIIAIYMIFLNFKEIMRIEYDGYGVSGKEITENLLGNSSEENKNLDLVKVKEQDKLYKKLNNYFIGENKKDEINLEYPIYINNNSTMYNLSQNMMLITDKFEEVSGYPNLTATNGGIYNQNDLERVDSIEYVFLKNKDNIYTNLKEIRITTVANEYMIPLNSSIYFDKETIRFYEVKDSKLIFKEIGDIDNNSKVQIGDKKVSYQELLTKLKILKEEKQDNDIEEIIKEDTSEESEKKNEEIKKEENEEANKQEEKVEEEGKYIKPEVNCDPFVANVYTMNTNLIIKDPSRVIQGAITFEVKKDGKIYLRKTYTSSGDIRITGLEPNTNYEIEGTYIYLNEQGRKVENTFYRGVVTTKGLQELKPIRLSFENGEIYSNKIQIVKLRISSDITEEAVKGVKRAEIAIGNASYEIKVEKLKQILSGQEIVYETIEGLKSNNKISYEIKFYDKQGNEMKLENNRGESKTAKRKPSVSIRIAKQNVIDITLGIKLNNKDNVEIGNYRYVIIKPNGDLMKEGGLKENDNEILLTELDSNQYYSIKIYGNYDINDNKGIRENQILGETIFATQPLSTLGYVNLEVEQQDVTTNSGKINIKIDEEKTDKRLIQILKELKVQIIEKGKNNGRVGTKENEIISEITIEGEELQKLKQAETREESYGNLESNTKYEVKITAKVGLGDTTEEIQATYNLKEFITLKQPAEIQMRNLFVTGDMIDFDVRIEDLDNASLTKKVRMELKDEKQNLTKIEYIPTNEEYIRKTFEKLELNKTYSLSFYADQYNEGNTDSTYKPNYLLKQLEIYTETGIIGSIGLTDLARKAAGKNLVDMSSEIKWYVYPNFNTNDYYGKEYNSNTKTLILGGHGNNRRAVYDLREYAGQTVTMSFKAKLVTEGSNGNSNYVYIQNKKTDGNRTRIEGMSTEEWKEFSYTMQLDTSGYLGFYIQGGNGIHIQKLQIELGEKRTSYEEYQYVLESKFLVNLEDKKNEITTDDYYLQIYENKEFEQEESFKELEEKNEVKNEIKKYLVSLNKEYKIELVVKINGREYILDSIEFATENSEEIKGIQTLAEFLEIQPRGKYIILTDLRFIEKGVISFGGENLPFDGILDFNGYSIIRNNNNNPIFRQIGQSGIIKNLVLEMNLLSNTKSVGLVSKNFGVISNINVNIKEKNDIPKDQTTIIGERNYGMLDHFIISFETTIHVKGRLCAGFVENYGTIKNGYIIGEDIDSDYLIESTGFKDIGLIARYNNENATIENIYSLVNIHLSEGTYNKNAGAIVDENRLNGNVKNVYSVGDWSNINTVNGRNCAKNSQGKVENSYYMSQETYQVDWDNKTTKLSLYDTNFQNKILNKENAFNVEEMIEKGYYPQLFMSECMPPQEYLPLPEVADSDLPDILYTEVQEQTNQTAIVKMTVNNPSAETITEIKIKNVDCEIISQEYREGISTVITKLQNPLICVSKYSILSISTKGTYNLTYTRNFAENERNIVIDLYKEINSIEDWYDMNQSPTENYMLMQDLDFMNNGEKAKITKIISGKIEGNMHQIRNIITYGGRIFYNVRKQSENK